MSNVSKSKAGVEDGPPSAPPGEKGSIFFVVVGDVVGDAVAAVVVIESHQPPADKCQRSLSQSSSS